MTSTSSRGRVRPDGVMVVSIWFIISAALHLLVAAGILIIVPAVMKDLAVESDGRPLMIAAFSFGLFLVVVLGVLDVAAAVGLLRLRVWGRWLAIGRAGLLLLAIPIGTVIGAFIIWYLLTPEAKQAFGAALPQPTPKESIKAAQPDHP